MTLPLIGTIDFTPTGVFLFFATVLAIGYFGYQLFGSGRAGRNAKASEGATPDAATPDAESDKDKGPEGRG